MGLIAAYGCTMWWSASATLAGRTRSTFGASAVVRYAQAGAERLRHRCLPCRHETNPRPSRSPQSHLNHFIAKATNSREPFPPAIEPEHGMVKAGVSHRQAE